jgi:competence protein ComEC
MMVVQSLSGIWVSKPLLRLLIPFILGIIIGRVVKINHELLFYSTGFFLTLVIAFVIEFKAKTIKLRIASGYLFLFSLFFAGAFLFEVNSLDQRSNFYGHYIQHQSETIFQVQIDEEPDKVKLGQRAFAKVQQVFLDDQKESIETIGRILLYFKNDSTQKQSFQYGDRIILHAKISEFNRPKNPDDFDYGQYLILNKVYRVAYINGNQILSLQRNKGNWLKTQSLRLKQDFISNLTLFPFFDGVAGIVAAFVTGDSGITDPDLINKFAATGTLHVLSVSGLHVGIIYVLLTWMTSFIAVSLRGKLFQLAIILIILWLYAFFTGFFPSVVRSTIMFSLISLGNQFSRKVNSINILSASALIMLAYDPKQLFNLGMQLSYSALAGILILTPHLSQLYIFKNNWANKAYQLICASFAAQLFTMPFSLFYFHQFSNYFLFANLIAIPISSVVTSVAFVSFLVGFIPILQKVIWYVLDYLVYILNLSVDFFANLPFAVFNFIPFDLFQFTILIFSLLILIYTIEMKAYRLKKAIILSIILLIIWLPIKELVLNEKSVSVFHHHHHFIFKVKKGVFADYFGFNDSNDEFIKKNLKTRIEKWSYHQIGKGSKIISVPNVGSFTCIDSLMYFNKIPQSDFLIIHNPSFSPNELENIPEYKQVIFTSKKYNYQKYMWLKFLKSKKQIVYEIKKNGIFQITQKKD